MLLLVKVNICNNALNVHLDMIQHMNLFVSQFVFGFYVFSPQKLCNVIFGSVKTQT